MNDVILQSSGVKITYEMTHEKTGDIIKSRCAMTYGRETTDDDKTFHFSDLTNLEVIVHFNLTELFFDRRLLQFTVEYLTITK